MDTLIWQKPPATIPKLQKDIIHVWRVSLEFFQSRINAIKSVLADDEKIQAMKFKFPEHQQRFIIARSVLRHILSYYLNQPPEKLIFQYSDYGKPYLVDQTIHFNLSHSGQWVLYTFSLQEKIGIDIEQIRENIACKDIAERFFSVYENQQLSQAPEAQRTDAFFRTWTCKEAFIKAIGIGLSFPLKEFDIDITTDKPRLVALNNNAKEINEWLFIPLPTPKDYMATVAVRAQIDTVKLWDFV